MDLELHLEQLIAERSFKGQPEESAEKMATSGESDKTKRRQQKSATGMSSSRRYKNNPADRAANRKLIGLNWSARLTIILVGTCLLFSLFFALDFFIAKLSSILITDAAVSHSSDSAGAHPKCLLGPNPLIDFERAADKLTCQLSASQATSSKESNTDGHELREGRPKFDYGLIFESELAISSDRQHYEFNSRKWPISGQLRLSRLFEAHQAAMPFDPDIWLHSEPEKQMHLLWGNLSECSSELGQLLRKLNQSPRGTDTMKVNGLERQKLQQLLDSFGRPESGSLLAHPFWLGSYLQCQQLNLERQSLQVRGADGSNRRLETRYCVGKVIMNSWPIQEHNDDQLQQPEQISFKVGLCLPKSCDSLALFRQQMKRQAKMNEADESKYDHNHFSVESVRKQVELLMRFNFNPDRQNGLNLFAANEMKLNDIYCLPLEESRRLDSVGFILLLLVFCWLSVSLVCTWIRWKGRLSSSGQESSWPDKRLLDIMAIDANLERFFSLDAKGSDRPEDNKEVNLDVLDSVKHLGCIGVIGAHVFLTYLTLGTAYSHIIEHMGKDMRTMLVLSLNNIVDTFFVISGLLASYLMFSKLSLERPSEQTQAADSLSGAKKTNHLRDGDDREAETKSRWSLRLKSKMVHVKLLLKMVAARYLRMAPLYFLVYAGTKSLATHIGSGPLWDYATNSDSLRGLCQKESWIWPLAFLSNFKPIAHHCVPPAWSLAVDLQFFLLMPLFMMALKHWPTRWSYSLIGLLVCLSSWSTFLDYRSLLDQSFVSLADFAKLRLHVFTILIKHSARGYSQPQNRMGPILIGLLGGHLLHEYEKRTHKKSRPASDSSRQQEEDGSGREWPHYMRGKWFCLILFAGSLFACAPALVRLRDQARSGNSNLLIRHSLALWTSTKFDCYLALVGFVLIKPLWSLCNLLLFLRLSTDLRHCLLGRLMSLAGWRTLSKLNYAILLVHFEFIAYEAMSRFAQTPISWPELLCKFCFAYLGSLSAALLLHVLVERPAHKLISWFLFGQPAPASTGRAGTLK